MPIPPDCSKIFSRPALILVILISISCGLNDGDHISTERWQSMENYQSIDINRRPGMGYCLLEGEIISGTLTITDENALFEGTTASFGDRETDDCLYDTRDPCIVEVSFGPHQISQNQVDELTEQLTNMPQKICRHYSGVSCDPCVILSITVDDDTVSADCCGDLNEDFMDAFDTLAYFLDQLAIAPQ